MIKTSQKCTLALDVNENFAFSLARLTQSTWLARNKILSLPLIKYQFPDFLNSSSEFSFTRSSQRGNIKFHQADVVFTAALYPVIN